ncbi:hypothetical protein CKO38_10110 [Rhodospirillum rubrum]|uniref:DUF924 family protein n=1 Tax=Rhodospirillum rubrum TaxID=1085 RepID=UPI001906ABF2|nr:DUF924 family protein [Rhodospirillum rubrum]MBK1665070.1 hypothetical protein [Rhodospirillum rubrum]MBK1677014.1 hypothetical protein [Rhodospirillum rubrum]
MMPPLQAALAADTQAAVEDRVLAFWFGTEDDPLRHVFRPWWMNANTAIDATMIALFTGITGDAAAGRLESLIETPRGALALVLLLDQFPRNLWRGHAKSFAADAKARAVATEILRRGYDKGYSEVERLFCAMPFEHSEDIVDQERALSLIVRLNNQDWYLHAMHHYTIIARFGRFPHRNVALKRKSTPAEEAFLTEPWSRF